MKKTFDSCHFFSILIGINCLHEQVGGKIIIGGKRNALSINNYLCGCDRSADGSTGTGGLACGKQFLRLAFEVGPVTLRPMMSRLSRSAGKKLILDVGYSLEGALRRLDRL